VSFSPALKRRIAAKLGPEQATVSATGCIGVFFALPQETFSDFRPSFRFTIDA
jgi:hypothetical protein